MTHSCWTAVAPLVDAGHNTFRIHVAGYTGGVASCVDFAVDGYTLMGHPLYYRILETASSAYIKVAQTDLNGTISYTEWDGLKPFDGTTGDPAGTIKGVNMGQIRQLFRILDSAQAYNCALVTANEYYSPSAVICFKAKAADAIACGTPNTCQFAANTAD